MLPVDETPKSDVLNVEDQPLVDPGPEELTVAIAAGLPVYDNCSVNTMQIGLIPFGAPITITKWLEGDGGLWGQLDRGGYVRKVDAVIEHTIEPEFEGSASDGDPIEPAANH